MDRLNRDSRLAVAISREHAHYNRLVSGSEFYCFEKDIIHEYAVAFQICQNFSYSAELNKFIGMASSGGLIKKWRSGSYIHGGYKHTEKYGQNLLGEFFGFFLIWVSILVITFFILFLERITYRKVRTPNTSRLWVIIELMIDSERHFLYKNKWIQTIKPNT